MSLFLSHYIQQQPIIHGPGPDGHWVNVLMKSGEYKHFYYAGYMLEWNAKFIAGARRVKVQAKAVCEGPNINSCKPLDPGWYLLGLHVSTPEREGVFVLCEMDFEPIQIFCPPGLPPKPRPSGGARLRSIAEVENQANGDLIDMEGLRKRFQR